MNAPTYTKDWVHKKPHYVAPPLLEKRAPRCPPYFEIDNSDQLLPYLEEVAKRPYNHGLHACWDLLAARQGLTVGHWHLHLYFPTVTTEMKGDNEMIIEDGRLCALDDPEIRKIAARYPHGDLWLQESWIPAVPGINVHGDYWKHNANDPLHWVKSELNICRSWHHLFMPMVGGDPKFCHEHADFWMPGSSCSCGHK